MWRNLSATSSPLRWRNFLDERIRLPVINFRINPSRYATKNPHTHTAAELHTHLADLAADRWIVRIAHLSLPQSRSDQAEPGF
jgi:hypothetical protein